MTDEELQQIKARAEAATKGPWGVLEKGISRRPPNNCPTVFATDTDLRFIAQCRDINEWNTGKPTDNLANAKFIAHARDDVPRLVAEVERLRGLPQMVANRIVDCETHHEALRQYVGNGLDEATVEVLLAWLDNLVRRVADEIDREAGYAWLEEPGNV